MTQNFHNQISSLKALKNTNSLSDPHQPHHHQKKRPKTIHRCILQRVSRSSSGLLPSLQCHVCEASHSSYEKYLNHLLDSTCAKRKEEKEGLNKVMMASASQIPTVLPEVNPSRKGRPPYKRHRSLQYQTQESLQEQQQQQAQQQHKHLSQLPQPTPPDEEIRIEAEYIKVSNGNNKKSPDHHQHHLPQPVTRPLVTVRSDLMASPTAAASTSSDAATSTAATTATVDFPSPPIEEDQRPKNVRSSISNNKSTTEETEEVPLNLSVNKKREETETDVENKEESSSVDIPALLPLRKRRSVRNEAESNSNSISKRTKKSCAHTEATELIPITLVEHANDQAKLANLKVQLTNLLVSLLGEARLTEMGYPETDILSLLGSVLEAARCPARRPDEDCVEGCKVTSSASANSNQFKFRRLRREIDSARFNVRRLLEICIPEETVWLRNGWDSKEVEEVLREIQEKGMGNAVKRTA